MTTSTVRTFLCAAALGSAAAVWMTSASPVTEARSSPLAADAVACDLSQYKASSGLTAAMDQQHVLFLNEPQGTPSLTMWKGDSRLQIGVSDTAPWLKVFNKDKVVWNQDWTGKPSTVTPSSGSQK